MRRKTRITPISGNHTKALQYSHIPAFRTLYKDVNKKSIETDVDEMWMFILRRYFPNDDRSGEQWSIVQQQRPKNKGLKKADILIRIEAKDHMVNMFFLEDKRYLYESSTLWWSKALEQLQDYMLQSSQSQSRYLAPDYLYGAVNIGRHVRFYVLVRGQTRLQDFMLSPNGQPYEVMRNEREIDQALMHWNREGQKYTSW